MTHEEILALARKHKDKIALKPKKVKADLETLTKNYIERFGTNRERTEK
jgi:hypothetical protein